MQNIKTAQKGIRAIAVYEAIKGVIGLVAGFGILSLMHRDIVAFAEDWSVFCISTPKVGSLIASSKL